jgi:hypothetical protein
MTLAFRDNIGTPWQVHHAVAAHISTRQQGNAVTTAPDNIHQAMDSTIAGMATRNDTVGGPYRHIYTANISLKRRESYVSTHIYLCY